MKRKTRRGLEVQDQNISNLLPLLPKPRGPSQIKARLLPAMLVAMKYALAQHSSIAEKHPSLAVNNIGTFGISELSAMILLDVSPRIFILLCWYGGENYSRLPCRTINPHRKKLYISCPLFTDEMLWFEAYKRLTVDKLVELFIDEIQKAYNGEYYSILFLDKEHIKQWLLQRQPVVALRRGKLRRSSGLQTLLKELQSED